MNKETKKEREGKNKKRMCEKKGKERKEIVRESEVKEEIGKDIQRDKLPLYLMSVYTK